MLTAAELRERFLLHNPADAPFGLSAVGFVDSELSNAELVLFSAWQQHWVENLVVPGNSIQRRSKLSILVKELTVHNSAPPNEDPASASSQQAAAAHVNPTVSIHRVDNLPLPVDAPDFTRDLGSDTFQHRALAYALAFHMLGEHATYEQRDRFTGFLATQMGHGEYPLLSRRADPRGQRIVRYVTDLLTQRDRLRQHFGLRHRR